MFLVILLYALFAFVFTLSKVGLEVAEPFFLMGSRMWLAGVLLIFFLAVTKKPLIPPKSAMGKIALLALVNIYLTNALEFWGLRYLTSAKTCFIYSLSPFASAILSSFLLEEQVGRKKWIGLTLGFFGFIPLFLDLSGEEIQSGSFFSFSLAELAVATAAITSVWGWILLKQLVTVEKVSPLMANGWSMFLGGTVALIHSGIQENWNPLPTENVSQYLGVTLGLILISNLVCYNLYGYLLTRFSANFVSCTGFVTPLFSAFFGWLFLGEIVSFSFWLSFALVASGLFLFHQEELVLNPNKALESRSE